MSFRSSALIAVLAWTFIATHLPAQFVAQPPVTLSGSVFDLACGDIEGDGVIEVAAATSVDVRVNSVQVGITPGGWALGRSISWGAVTPQVVRAVTFADLDGNPGDELIATTPAGILIFGITGATTTDLVLLAVIPPVSVSTTINRPVVAADTDGDGDIDLVYGENSQYYSFRNDGGLVFTTVWNASSSSTPVLIVTDWNGDLIPDLFVATGQSRYLPGLGNGMFGSSVAVASPLGTPVSADLCRLTEDDSLPDLVIFSNTNGGSQPGLERFVSFGPGTFFYATHSPNIDHWGAMADVHGDLSLLDDMILKTGSSGIPELRVNPGNGDFSAVVGTPLPLTSSSDVFEFVDANGDGSLDILSETTASGTNSLVLVLNMEGLVTAQVTASPTVSPCNTPIDFDASTSIVPAGRAVVAYDWDFDDGMTLSTAVPTTSHAFASIGAFDVTVTLTDDLGRTTPATVMVSINTSVGTPTADAQGAYVVGAGQTLHLAGSGIDSCGGNALTFDWDVDDDGLFDDAAGATPMIAASQLNSLGVAGIGSHPLHLRVTDTAGLTATATTTFTVVSGAVTTITGYAAVGAVGRVEVSWASVTEPMSLVAFRIDRANSPAGTFTPLATFAAAGPGIYRFVDILAPPGLPRTYRLVEILTGGPGAVLAAATATAITPPTANQPQASLYVNGQQPSVVDPAGHQVVIPTPGPLTLTVETGTNTFAPLILLNGQIQLGAMPTVIGTIDLAPSTINVAANGLSPNPAAFLDQFMYTDGGSPSRFSLTLNLPALTQTGPAIQFIVFDPAFPPFNLRVTEAAELRFDASLGAGGCPASYGPYEPPSLTEPWARPGRRNAGGHMTRDIGIGPGGETEGDASIANPMAMVFDPAFTHAAPADTRATVLMHSGELLISALDLVIPGVGTDFVWARTYRSRTGPDRMIGRGWTHSYDVRIESVGGNLLLHDGCGRQDVYVAQPGGTWVANGLFRSINVMSGGFRLLFEDRGEWHFHALNGSAIAGKLQMIRDRNGNTLMLAYEPDGDLDGITDTLGRFIDVQYTASGAVDRIVDSSGRQVVYGYDSAPAASMQRLISVTSPVVVGTPHGNDFPAGRTVTYTYRDGTGVEALDDNLVAVTDALGQTWLGAIYDEAGSPASSCTYDHLRTLVLGDLDDRVDFEYETLVPSAPNGQSVRRVIVNDRLGQISEFSFDGLNRCTERLEYTGRAPNADGPTTSTLNRPLARLRSTDPTVFVRRISYDVNSLPRVVQLEDGSFETYTWDSSHADPRLRGNLLQHRHDAGPLGGDQSFLTRSFAYHPGFGGGFGARFVQAMTNRRGHVTTRTFDGAGNCVHVAHPVSGVEEDFTYDSRGRLLTSLMPANTTGHRRRDDRTYHAAGPQSGYLATKTIDATGSTTRTSLYQWDAVGHLVSLTDTGGFTWLNTWTALDELVRTESPMIAAAGGARLRMDTHYDGNGNLIRRDKARFDEAGTVSGDGLWTTTWTYEILNRTASMSVEADDGDLVTTDFDYDANRNLTLVRKGEAVSGAQPGNVVAFEHDERDLVYRIEHGLPVVRTDQVDPDLMGRTSRSTRGLGTGARIRITTRDGYGRIVADVDPMGNRHLHHYDGEDNLTLSMLEGELIDVVGSSGNVRLEEESAVFDALQRRTALHRAYFDPATQAPIGDGMQSTTWTYAPDSQIALTVNDNGHATSYLHDDSNRLSQVTDAAGNLTNYAYDTRDNVVTTNQLELSGVGGPPTAITTTATYDEVSRRLTMTDGVGNVTSNSYDSRSIDVVYRDGNNRPARRIVDGLDRVIATVVDMDADGANPSDAADIVTTMAYDDSSRLILEVDDKGNATSHFYDALDRRIQTTYADGTQRSVTLDAQDDPVSVTDANGSVSVTTFDLLGRRTLSSHNPGPGVSSDITTEIRRWDGRSLLVEGLDDLTAFERSHDSLRNLSSETLDGLTTNILRDALGSVLSLGYPGGRIVNYGRDSLERISQIDFPASMTTFATLDWLGRESIERMTFDSGVALDCGYDGILRPTSRHYHTAGNTLDQIVSTWDANHRRTSHVDLVDGSGFPSLGRDAAYRVTSAQVQSSGGGVLPITYTLDGVGNRTMVSGGPAAGSYVQDATTPEPADSQVNQYTTSAGQARTYDRNGNLVHRAASPTFGTNPLDLVYDVRDHLVSSTDLSTGVMTTYRYDVLGRRIEKKAMSGMTTTSFRRYLYLGRHVIEERNGIGGVAGTYVLGPGGRPLSLRRGATNYLLHSDDTGAIFGVSDDAGAMAERYRYSPFGELAILDGNGVSLLATAIDNHWCYRGFHDAETGLDFHGHDLGEVPDGRYYDPQVARYTSRGIAGRNDGWRIGVAPAFGFQAADEMHGMAKLRREGPMTASNRSLVISNGRVTLRATTNGFMAGDGMNGMFKLRAPRLQSSRSNQVSTMTMSIAASIRHLRRSSTDSDSSIPSAYGTVTYAESETYSESESLVTVVAGVIEVSVLVFVSVGSATVFAIGVYEIASDIHEHMKSKETSGAESTPGSESTGEEGGAEGEGEPDGGESSGTEGDGYKQDPDAPDWVITL